MTAPPPHAIEVLAPNLKRRLSGVTATIARLVPVQARAIGIVAAGPGLPEAVPQIGLGRVLMLPRRPWRVWHARRNTEMALGLILRHLLRKRLRLLFTSASQRRHTGYTRWLIARMDRVVATSSASAAYLEVPCTVIRHGIDTDAFRPAADRAALRADLGLPEGVLAGCYGRIRHQKGTDAFVAAMLALMPDHADLHAVILGRATPEHREFDAGLRARVAEAGLARRFHFMGEARVDEMPRWYAALDLFVAPQRWEGFGLTPLEAMAAAVPVVATTVGAFPELVVDGETGALVPPGEPAAIARALAPLLADPAARARMGEAARAHVARHFRLEAEAAALVALYREMLEAGR
jgi:mannosyltransferase